MADRAKRPVVRLVDVATRAFCSAATVSRVLNAPETVNGDVRRRVEAAVCELGYTRNGAARALRSRRSRIVGIILATLKQPVHAVFIEALQGSLARQNYSLIVTTSEYSLDRELVQARTLAERGVDGLVLIGHTHRPELFDLLRAQELPYVTSYTFRPDLDHPVIGFDSLAAMETIVDHLHGIGHRDFALLGGASDGDGRVEERLQGAVAALARRGLALRPDHIVEGNSTVEGGRVGLRRLAGAKQRPTALICTSDVLAYGALVECRALGIAVPRDLSLVGFDGLEASTQTLPALTTLAIPDEEMGRRAAEYMLARIAGSDLVARMRLPTRLMIRDTTAPPPVPGRSPRLAAAPAAAQVPDDGVHSGSVAQAG